MKAIPILAFVLLNICLHAQKYNFFKMAGNDLPLWHYQDFIKNHITTVNSYVFRVKKSGKIAQDSIEMLAELIIVDSNMVLGNRVFEGIGVPDDPRLRTIKFAMFYDKKGKVLKETGEPLNIIKSVEFGSQKYGVSKD